VYASVLGWRNAFACSDPVRLCLILNESLLQCSVGGAKVGSPAANPVQHTRMHDFFSSSLSLTHTHFLLSHPALRSTVWPIISRLHDLWPRMIQPNASEYHSTETKKSRGG